MCRPVGIFNKQRLSSNCIISFINTYVREMLACFANHTAAFPLWTKDKFKSISFLHIFYLFFHKSQSKATYFVLLSLLLQKELVMIDAVAGQ